MILRELIAVFGLNYDNSGQKQAERGIDGLKQKFSGFQSLAQTAFGILATAGPLIALAKMASDAQENLNLLSVTFDDNASKVEEWAKKTGPAIGRSVLTMQELAAEFGALLRPMVGSNDALVDMSTNLAQVAVDLSSLRNISEADSLQALQSALSGSAIAVRRFGIDLRSARVEAEAMRMGINKNVNELSQSEQATIRYNLIMKDLAFVAGDAANTQWQFANSSRALRDQLKDIGTTVGLFFVPAFEDLMRGVRGILRPIADMVDSFVVWNRETNLALGLLATLGLVLGATLLQPLMTLLLSMAPLIVAFVLFGLIADDIITTFQGGQSVIKEFTDWLDELGANLDTLNPLAAALVVVFNGLRDVLGALGVLSAAFVESLMVGDWAPLSFAVDALVGSFKDWIKPLTDVVDWLDKITASDFFSLLKNKGLALAADLGFDASQPLGPAIGSGPVNAAERMGAPAGMIAAGKATAGVTVISEGPTVDIQVTQQPGESGEELAKRIDERISQKEDERALAIQAALAPEPGG